MKNSKHNLLHVCLAEGFGGLEKYFIESSKQLRKVFDIELLVKENSGLHEQLKGSKLNYETIRFTNYIDILAIYKIRSLVKRKDIDTVFFHGSTELGLIVPALIGLNTKLINRKSVIVTSSKKDIYHYIIYKGVDTFIAQTPFMKKNLLKKYPINESRIKIVPNGLELKKFQRSTYPKILSKFHPKNDFTFITSVSRVVPEKGIKKFVELANFLTKKHGDYVFFIVGDGPETFIQNLKKLRNSNTSSRIIFTGYQTNVPAVLNETDLFVTFAEAEQFGMSLLEGKAMNLPILSRDTIGAKYHLENFPDFIIKEKELNDFKMLDNKIKHILNNFQEINYDLSPFDFSNYKNEIKNIISEIQGPNTD